MSGETLRNLLAIAWLLPLVGFLIEVLGGYWGENRKDKRAAYCAVFCIAAAFVCSAVALFGWLSATHWEAFTPHGDPAHGAAEHVAVDPHGHDVDGHGNAGGDHGGEAHAVAKTDGVFAGSLYSLGRFGSLSVTLDYYIDSLTLVMFTMVTLIATCIHVFAIGYMSDELTEDYADHQVHLPGGHHFHRPGRFYRFFSYMSLFCFAMLGLVLSGNIFQVFVFWELVGICSYLLIGFYIERKSASNAANKAFIMNRVGDFGFLIGLMVIWTWFGTFQFTEHQVDGQTQPGLFQMVQRSETGFLQTDPESQVVYLQDGHGHTLQDASGNVRFIPYILLVVAGIGVFAGCIGKSAQFPLQTWLPDAMEGPTPVSALVHSATMVAAGVYLAGRFYPMFTPEVLLVIAYIGCITLFLAATIAMVATDLKKVLAYSTISQLGYMMLGLGVFGWGAGLFHLITHAFFKSLMFLCSGSVIYGCHHEQEMPKMGGLIRKMPWTGWTMLVGVIAISGLAIPGVVAFSGYHSKDAIVATALAYVNQNSGHFLLFWIPLITAGLTAFYMFRLWFYTFLGKPRDEHVYQNAHESPWVMIGPLVVLSVFAAFCAVGGEGGKLYQLLSFSEPPHVANGIGPTMASPLSLPSHFAIGAVHGQAGISALIAAGLGTLAAYLIYVAGIVRPDDIRRQLSGLYDFLVAKWQFDELYDVAFVRPVHVIARWCASFDQSVLDGVLHWSSRMVVKVSNLDRKFDEMFVDGAVNLVGSATQSFGRSLKVVQTGQLRQYVMFIAVGVLVLFVSMFLTFPN